MDTALDFDFRRQQVRCSVYFDSGSLDIGRLHESAYTKWRPRSGWTCSASHTQPGIKGGAEKSGTIIPDMSSPKKLILVIGATGAQGRAVIDGLLAPSTDGSPSPYAIRALTRDPTSRRAKELIELGVECVKGTSILWLA